MRAKLTTGSRTLLWSDFLTQESKAMAAWQLGVGFGGLAIIAGGVACSAFQALPCVRWPYSRGGRSRVHVEGS